MRILLLNQFYKPDVAATGQLLADLAEELAARGHEVHVLCSRQPYNGGDMVLSAAETVNGVCVHRVRTTRFGRTCKLGRMAAYLSFYVLASWRALRLPKIDVCMSLTPPPFIALVGHWLRLLKGTRLVLWSMDVYPQVAVALGELRGDCILYRLLSRLSRHLYKDSSCIVSLGEVMTSALVRAGAPPHKIITVHNWVPGEVTPAASAVL